MIFLKINCRTTARVPPSGNGFCRHLLFVKSQPLDYSTRWARPIKNHLLVRLGNKILSNKEKKNMKLLSVCV
jgi:hypothetical protein